VTGLENSWRRFSGLTDPEECTRRIMRNYRLGRTSSVFEQLWGGSY